MFDVKKAQDEAKEELAKERTDAAKKKIKSKLKDIESARAVVRNLEREYEVLLEDIGEAA